MNIRIALFASTWSRGSRLGPLFCLAILAAFALISSPALAVEIHVFTSSFGTAGSGPGQFSANRGMAIDQSDGSVYVADAGNFRVQKFDAAGNFVLAFGKGVNQTTSGDVCTAASGDACGVGTKGSGGSGFDTNNGFSDPGFVAVDPTNGDVYVADIGPGAVDKFSSAGTYLSANDGSGSGNSFGALAGIAVDVSRNLWAYDEKSEISEMREFDSTGAFLTQWSSGYVAKPRGIAVDSASNLYVVRGTPFLEKFTSTGTDLGEANESSETASLAIDPGSDDLYVGEESSQVRRYAGGCSVPCSSVESFGSGSIANAAGVAVRGSNATAYVSDPGNSAVEIFEALVLPGLSIEAASAVVGGTKATLHGSVNPDNLAVTDCKFEYGKTTNYGKAAPCVGAIPTDASNHSVSAALTNLNPGATYHFRIIATNANGTNKSSDETFTTNQPAVTGAATEVKGTRATLNATVLPEGEAVSECFFEYGAGQGYGKTAPCVGMIPTDEGEHAVTAALTHLAPNTPYHFRLVISHGTGPIRGADKAFQTQATVITGAASAIAPPSASIEGTVNPEGILYTACFFEYGPTSTYGSSVPCAESPGSIGGGTNPVAVHANLPGLTFGAVYHYRLVGTNIDGTSRGGDQSFQTSGAVIEVEQTIAVGTDEAKLETRINPKGAATTYHLEYGTDASYGNNTSEILLEDEEGSPIEDDAGHTASEVLEGLAPKTTYHWRVVATNSVGVSEGPDRSFTTSAPALVPETSCPNQAFRSGPTAAGANLPDCRAYEQASPVDKHGANIQRSRPIVQASSAGGRITFANAAGLPTTGGSSSSTVYAATRGAGAWSTDGLGPLLEPGRGFNTLGWDEEIAASAFRTQSAAGGGLTLGDTASGTYQLVVPGKSNLLNPFLADFAADTSHFIFESDSALVPGVAANRINLYEVNHGALSLAGRIPAAPATACDDAGGPTCIPPPEGSFAGSYAAWTLSQGTKSGGASRTYYTQNTISEDGTKVFFTTAGNGQLYVREEGTVTTQISASQASTPDPNGPLPAAFMAATPSGSKVFFTSCEKLTEDSTAVSTVAETCTGKEEGQDLYSYDSSSGDLTDLTPDSNVSDPQRAGVVGVLGASADGSYVYFAANGVLAPGASPGHCTINAPFQESGICNLYLFHDGTTTFIASVDGQHESENWTPLAFAGNQTTKISRVTANGVLLFTSTQSLTNYENNLRTGGGCSPYKNADGPHCPEFYRYTPTGGELNCVSCNPTGVAPIGSPQLEDVGFNSTSIQLPFLSRNISADGNRVFFDSPDALVAADTNGVNDPYEWEAAGIGSCKSVEANGGCLYLLSPGGSSQPSYLGDVSASGDDAFFFTDLSLVPADKDELTDVYDARVGGGLASQNAPPLPLPCAADEACKGPASGPGSETSPGTSTFNGPPNRTKKPAKGCKKRNKKQCKKSSKSKKHKKSRGVHANRGGSK